MWAVLAALSRNEAWHSHRIDLADHGRRETNYVEMLEWSTVEWWFTMRFVPGAINRWRANEHLHCMDAVGIHVLSVDREVRESLPTSRSRLARRFRLQDDVELGTTAIDVVGRTRLHQ